MAVVSCRNSNTVYPDEDGVVCWNDQNNVLFKSTLENADDMDLYYWRDVMSGMNGTNDEVELIICELNFRYLMSSVVDDSISVGHEKIHWMDIIMSECAKDRYRTIKSN